MRRAWRQNLADRRNEHLCEYLAADNNDKTGENWRGNTETHLLLGAVDLARTNKEEKDERKNRNGERRKARS